MGIFFLVIAAACVGSTNGPLVMVEDCVPCSVAACDVACWDASPGCVVYWDVAASGATSGGKIFDVSNSSIS